MPFTGFFAGRSKSHGYREKVDMKIFHFIDSGGLYGAEVMLLNLMVAQKELGVDPVLVSIGTPGEEFKGIENRAKELGFKVKPVRMKSGLNITGAIRLFNLAQKENALLLHSHGYKTNILLGLLPFGWRKIPLVTTLHGWTSTGKINRMMLYEWLDAVSLRFIDRVILVNYQMQEHQRLKKLKKYKVKSIENGLDISAVEMSSKIALEGSLRDFIEKKFTIVGVGRFSREKNFSDLVDTVSTLIKDGLDIQLLLLGDGYGRTQLEKQVELLGLHDRVMMPGFLCNIAKYLKIANIFAMPSLTEGLPMALLEAMAMRIPIVASSVGGIPNAMGHGLGGLLYPANNNDALKNAILDIFQNTDNAVNRAEWSRMHLEEKYSNQRMAKDYLAVYQDVLGGALDEN